MEIPVFADRRGFNGTHTGALPPQCAALNAVSIAVEEMAVEAAITGNPRLAFQSIAYDPLPAAMLSLAEIEDMVNAMFQKNRDHLPQFKTTVV